MMQISVLLALPLYISLAKKKKKKGKTIGEKEVVYGQHGISPFIEKNLLSHFGWVQDTHVIIFTDITPLDNFLLDTIF